VFRSGVITMPIRCVMEVFYSRQRLHELLGFKSPGDLDALAHAA